MLTQERYKMKVLAAKLSVSVIKSVILCFHIYFLFKVEKFFN